MRKRSLLVAAAVLGVAALPGVAAAEPADEASPPPDIPTAADEVTLPTGEQVVTAPDGTVKVGDGTTSFTMSRTPDGDRVVVPFEAIDDIAAGTFDRSEFNIDSPGDRFSTAAAASVIPVSITGRWLDGSTPDYISADWINLETGRKGQIDRIPGGTLDLAMAPGRYHMITELWREDGESFTSIVSFEEIRVRGRSTEIEVDGTRAQPVGFDLERDEAEPVSLNLVFTSYEPGTDQGLYRGYLLYGDRQLYAIPSNRFSDARDVGLVLRAGYASPEGAEDAYSYTLFDSWDDGLPDDLTPEAEDEDLARIDAEYQTLGVEAEFNRMDLSQHARYPAGFWTSTGPVHLPSERTEFYTADEDVTWSHRGYFDYEGGIGDPYDTSYQFSGVLEPGSETSTVWHGAPLSVGLDRAGADTMWPLVYRWDERDGLWTSPWMFSSTAAHEAIHSDFHPGKITLAQNGEILGQNSEVGLGTPLWLIEPGRLSLSVDTAREASWTALGTASSALWEFDYDPTGNPIQPVSVVDFTASGVENGYAEAGTVQQFELEFATQPGADDQVCAAMTFEVSFDDGATWTEVAIDRDGDTATAQLELPDEPGFVSVRFTAADEAGNTVQHETIRSYGLR